MKFGPPFDKPADVADIWHILGRSTVTIMTPAGAGCWRVLHKEPMRCFSSSTRARRTTSTHFFVDLPPPPDAPEIKIGKATKYDAETMLAKVVELGRFGKSKAQIARQLGVNDKMLAAWADRHPEFAEAMQAARTLALAFRKIRARSASSSVRKDFNVTAWHTQVKARFPDEYRDDAHVALSSRRIDT